MSKMPKRTFKVAVQVRDVRFVTVRASDAADAVEQASKRVERTGAEVIACRPEAVCAGASN